MNSCPPSLDSHLVGITDRVLDSYREAGGINNIDGINLPSKRAVGEICELLLQLLFPGYHDQEAIHSSELARLTGYRIREVAGALREEVDKTLKLRPAEAPPLETDAVVCRFLNAIPEIRTLLQSDLAAAFEGDPATVRTEEIIIAYPFIETIAIQRMARTLYLEGLPLLPRIMTEWAHGRSGIDIHPGARIGSHFFIDHGTGVVIGETCEIGSHVKLYHGVTLGARSFQKDDEGRIRKGGKRHPNVGDHVTIYPGSTILGGDTFIGDHSTIGGNAFLQQSVPPHSLVIYEERNLRIVSKLDRQSVIDWVI